jgi:hypothetical protein
MPSPFPGIDPYLEGPHWPDFHDTFITYARDEIQPQLTDRYIARVNDRVVLAAGERAVIPDVTVVRRPVLRETATTKYSAPAEDGIAFDDPTIYNSPLDDIREPYIEIRDRHGECVVTTVELLSPINKTPGHGRESYLHKLDESARAGVNLVEIDLLHGGHRTVAPGLLLNGSEKFYSIVVVWRTASRRHEVYFVQLRARLPRIRVPLMPEDGDVSLDIQSVYSRCYDAGRYGLDLDYSHPPPVELSTEDTDWVEHVLLECGLHC